MADSVATSHDKHDRPTKKRALSPTSKQAASVDALFANPTAALSGPRANGRGTGDSHLSAPPEIVANVQGSSAGAGSGEFHVYKASRRREYERLRVMDEETAKEAGDAAYEAAREEKRQRDEEKTGKNRARREKARLRKEKDKAGGGDGQGKGTDGARPVVAAAEGKVRLKANGTAGGANGEVKQKDRETPAVVEEAGIVIHDDD